MIPRQPLAVVALATAALLAACSSPVKLDEPAKVEDRKPTTAGGAGAAGSGSGAASTGTPQSQVATVDLAKQRAEEEAAALRAAAGLPKIVYFDFDSFVVKDEFKPLIEGHAKAMSMVRSKKMVLEGHADERGGREYNLALGQKRAEAVSRALALLGVADNQVEAVSFGEERPADAGHDEAAWAKNRRVEMKDR